MRSYVISGASSVEDVLSIIREAQRRLPGCAITLGCMRPGGSYRRELDLAAIRAGIDLLRAQRDLLLREEADVIVPRSTEGLEPLHAIYRRETCLPAIEAAIDADQWKVIAWFPQVRVRILTSDELKQFDPDGLAFWNVNTPEEFIQAEQLAQTKS